MEKENALLEAAQSILDGLAVVSVYGLDDNGRMLVRIKNNYSGKVVDLASFDFVKEAERIIAFKEEMKNRSDVRVFIEDFAHFLWEKEVGGSSDIARSYLEERNVPPKAIKVLS